MSESQELSAPKRSPIRTTGSLSIVLTSTLALLLYFYTDWHFYWVWLIAVSLITFFLYGIDKAQAKRQAARVPELILHSLALLGGFLGGWLGRFLFRHKTQKELFAIILTAGTALHLGVMYYLFINQG